MGAVYCVSLVLYGIGLILYIETRQLYADRKLHRPNSTSFFLSLPSSSCSAAIHSAIGITLFVVLCYVITKVTNSIYNAVPLLLPVAQFWLFQVMRRISLYDMKENLAGVFEERSEYAYICFDSNNRYRGCSKLSLELFPSLEKLRVDEHVPEGGDDDLALVLQHLDEWIHDRKEHIAYIGENGAITISCKVRPIIDRKRIIGNLLEMCDITHLHELGEIAVNDRILRKKGKFTEAEFAEMQKHPEEGARMVPVVLGEVEDAEFKTIAENVAHYHHEKWDGNGYPCGLKEEEISVEARIMALADVFDALVSRRCYKDAFSCGNAFDIIRDSLGTQFDPELGKIFLECRTQLEEIYSSFDLK